MNISKLVIYHFVWPTFITRLTLWVTFSRTKLIRLPKAGVDGSSANLLGL